MKTPILRKYESKFAQVNDQLCYFFFADWEVEKIFRKTERDNSDLLTTDVFSDNKFSPRLQIKLEKLPCFRNGAYHTLVAISIIAAVEYLLSYIDEIEIFRSNVSPSQHDEERDDKTEEQLNKKLKGWLGARPEIAIIKTIKYLRLRRNHLAHLREQMSNDLTSFIKNDAHFLNRFWGERKTNIYDFDFSKKDLATFNENEAFALLNLIIVSMKIVDEIVLSTLSLQDLVRYELDIFLTNKAINGRSFKCRVRKFEGMLVSKYGTGIKCSQEEFISCMKAAQPDA